MKRTVWVVEDDVNSREGMAEILRHEGYRVVAAGNGKESLDLLLTGTAPDLILLDMMAPSFDGWRFLEQRKRNPALAGVPVIIITGLGIASPDWANSLGASGFHRKPVDVDTLLKEIEVLLNVPKGGAPSTATEDEA